MCHAGDPVMDKMARGVKLSQDELFSLTKTIAAKAHEQVQKVLMEFAPLYICWRITIWLGAVGGAAPLHCTSKTRSQEAAQTQGNLAARLGSGGCPGCSFGKDYDATCPESWTITGDHTCDPPASYTGFCKQSLDLSLSTEVDKDELEISCKFCWPCKTAF
jgi:CPW-WPC domain-containing protein